MMALAALQIVLFVLGVLRRSYAALAIPVALLVGVITVLAFWVGWTLASMEDDLAGLEFEAEPLDEA